MTQAHDTRPNFTGNLPLSSNRWYVIAQGLLGLHWASHATILHKEFRASGLAPRKYKLFKHTSDYSAKEVTKAEFDASPLPEHDYRTTTEPFKLAMPFDVGSVEYTSAFSDWLYAKSTHKLRHGVSATMAVLSSLQLERPTQLLISAKEVDDILSRA